MDHIFSDAPFDVRTHRASLESGSRIDGKRRIAGALPFAPLDESTLPTLARQFVRVTKRWVVVFSAERQIEAWASVLEGAGARVVRVGLALRTNPRPQMSGDRPAPPADFLVIAHATPGRMKWNGRGKAGVWDSPAARWDTGGKNAHPTQKALRLMRGLISDFSNPGDLVCDPFAGSGSTAVACKELGRRFVGWEIEPTYHALACARVLHAIEQLQLAPPGVEASSGNRPCATKPGRFPGAWSAGRDDDLPLLGRIIT